MASDINSTTIVGRLTKDSELKYTNSGMAVAKLSIANNYSKKNGDQWETEVNYFDVSIWGRQAEALNQYLQKGTQIAVMGELRQERWEQDGQKRSRVSINAKSIQLLGSKDSSQQSNGYGSNQQPKPNNQSYQNNSQSFESDIPF